MAKQLTKSHCTALAKVAQKLAYRQKMDSTQLILGTENEKKVQQAEQLIHDAIRILSTIN